MPVAWNLARISEVLQKPVEDVTVRAQEAKMPTRRSTESRHALQVIVLDRPRHSELIAEIRSAGARIRLISDGDVAAAIATARPDSGVDVLWGIGGCAEGVIAAAALKCMGGAIQGRLWPRHEEDRAAILAAGLDPTQVLTTSQLCGGDEVFFAATGVSDGDLLRGVRFTATGATTTSMVMRHRSGTIREARARPLERKRVRGALPTPRPRRSPRTTAGRRAQRPRRRARRDRRYCTCLRRRAEPSAGGPLRVHMRQRSLSCGGARPPNRNT